MENIKLGHPDVESAGQTRALIVSKDQSVGKFLAITANMENINTRIIGTDLDALDFLREEDDKPHIIVFSGAGSQSGAGPHLDTIKAIREEALAESIIVVTDDELSWRPDGPEDHRNGVIVVKGHDFQEVRNGLSRAKEAILGNGGQIK